MLFTDRRILTLRNKWVGWIYFGDGIRIAP